MQLRKSPQRSNTVKLFCYLISRRITCGTLFAQGFAKTKQTWKSSNRSWGTRTSKRLWMSTLKRLSRKSRNLLKDWLQNWTFFNRWRNALMGRSKWQQNHWMTANWQQTKENKSVVWGMFDQQASDVKASRSLVGHIGSEFPRWSPLTKKHWFYAFYQPGLADLTPHWHQTCRKGFTKIAESYPLTGTALCFLVQS